MATASRDLRDAVKKGILQENGHGNRTVYGFRK